MWYQPQEQDREKTSTPLTQSPKGAAQLIEPLRCRPLGAGLLMRDAWPTWGFRRQALRFRPSRAQAVRPHETEHAEWLALTLNMKYVGCPGLSWVAPSGQ